MGKIATLCLVVLACLVISIPASAGTLDGISGALTSGSTSFVGATNTNLAGYVDWAVFEGEDFPDITGGEWTPTSGELVYLYQVFSTGSDYISKFSLPVSNPVTNIGDFTEATNDVVPAEEGYTGDDVYWGFGDESGDYETIPPGEHSTILAFNSLNLPINGYGITVNGGSVSFVIPVPTPGGSLIPEPATCTLLLMGLAMATMTRFGRR